MSRQFKAEGLYGDGEPNNSGRENDAEDCGRRDRINLSVATSPLMRIRGFVMLLMMAEVLQLSRVLRRTRLAFWKNPGV